jgi:hypothetical protein
VEQSLFKISGEKIRMRMEMKTEKDLKEGKR